MYTYSSSCISEIFGAHTDIIDFEVFFGPGWTYLGFGVLPIAQDAKAEHPGNPRVRGIFV